MRIDVVDCHHGDDPVDFHAIAAAGAVGVILKATQGSTHVDPKFLAYRQRALTVFEPGCVHSYHFLDGTDPVKQVEHYLAVTRGMGGRWLDWEPNPVDASNTASLAQTVLACRTLQGEQGLWPGMYGSGLLMPALDAGHFSPCPIWLARYKSAVPPVHACQLWQFAEGEPGEPTIGGKGYDVSEYQLGDRHACAAWMKKLAGVI